MKMIKTVAITGISGSGGSHLAEYIIDNHSKVKVHGLYRWHSTSHLRNLDNVISKISLHECDLNDFSALVRVIRKIKPDVIFHLASHTNVRVSFIEPLSVIQNNVMITANLMEAIRLAKIDPVVLIASTAECYGQVDPKNVPIREDCPMNPQNPYAISKATQDLLSHLYYKSYGLKVIRTRAFTYINPRRGDLFATTFAKQIALIEAGKQKILKHGNLKSQRTIIDVRDIMEGYWMVVTRGKIGEVYNIGGLKTMTVGEVLEVLKRKAKCKISSRIDKNLLRPSEVMIQIPDLTKIKKDTGWRPKYTFEESIEFLLNHVRKEVAEGQ